MLANRRTVRFRVRFRVRLRVCVGVRKKGGRMG